MLETRVLEPAAPPARHSETLVAPGTAAATRAESPLGAWTEPLLREPFERSGYARLRDLESPRLVQEIRDMEGFIARFVARTRELYTEDFAFTGDKLYNWSRRWEYPYCWWNLRQGPTARILDAGSGFTFFPYLMRSAGAEVSCADLDASLPPAFARASALTGLPVEYKVCPIEELQWADGTFDSVACVSVLEHAPRRFEAIREFARVLKPGGRLVMTWDISLSRDSDVKYEDACVLLDRLQEHFEPVYEVDLHRPADLLTTERMLAGERWRLSWRPHHHPLRRFASWLRHGSHFHTLAVLGTVWKKKG